MAQKKGILIDATGGGSGWIGGLYYKKNVLFSLMNNRYIIENYFFVVISEEENRHLFDEFEGKIQFIPFETSGFGGRTGRLKFARTIYVCIKHHCKYIFPCGNSKMHRFGIIPIHWNPDFQHNRLPGFFGPMEVTERDRTCRNYAEDQFPLVLSSNDSLNDYRKFYDAEGDKAYVVPFVSYIESLIRQLSPVKEEEILKKYKLDGQKYVCIMNQFWQHKNHGEVLDAMKIYFSRNPDSRLIFTFTGKLEDYRALDYIEKLKNLFAKKTISDHSRLLGFIDRIEQIAIMKNALFVIQPSLFEGWGTVVEDAKVLDKRILLSDIPVHREQRSLKCRLFDPHDPQTLAELIEEEAAKEQNDDVEAGIADMYRRAAEYSKGFEQLLKEQEKCRE